MKKLGILTMLLALFLSIGAKAAEPKNVVGSLDVTFYGYVKVDAIYEDAKAYGLDYIVWAPPGDLHDGTTTVPPGYDDDDFEKNSDASAFGITARQTRFGFKIKGPTFGKNGQYQVLGKIEADFYGATTAAMTDSYENKGNFALRIAEIELKSKYWGILAGNEWMIMSPIFPHSSNYTYGAELGSLGYRMPQIRFTGYMMDGRLQLQAAVDNKIGDSLGYADIDSGRNSGQPDVQGGLVWDSMYNNKPFKLGVTGHYAREEMGGVHNPSVNSWSWNVHAMLPITKWLSLNGEYFNGANLDGYYCGSQGKGWIINEDGELEALKDTGGWGEIELGPVKNWVVYAGYGIDDVNNDQLKDAQSLMSIDPTKSKPIYQAITRNSNYYASVHYWVVPKVADISFEWMQVRSEYELAKTKYGVPARNGWLDVDDGLVNRYTLSFWLFF